MPHIVEQDVEDACLDWFEELGYQYCYGPDISLEGTIPERKNWDEIILIERLRTALKKINNVPEIAIDEALKKIIYPNTQNLLENNHNFHKMITNGISVQYQENGETKHDIVFPIEFEPEKINNDDFLVVNQFTIKDQKEPRRPDVILFVNGIPLVIL